MESRKILSVLFLSLAAISALFLYRNYNASRVEAPRRAAMPLGHPLEIKAPLGLPPVPIPADNPPTAETVALGRKLYYDPILSADNSISCASCHDPRYGFADPRPVSEGMRKQKGSRNSPPVMNAAYFEVQFWDGRAPSLEKQAEGPVANPVEMAHSLTGVEQKLSADPKYREEFAAAWGPGPITYEMVEKSIASFERTVLIADSPFDRWKFGGDENAVDAAVKRGFVVFTAKDKGNCAACHSVGEHDALFTDNKFHNIGVGVKDEKITDAGRFEVTRNEADRGAFKTPSLRNIALSAPYMHDGSLKDLKQVMDFYIGGANSNSNLDKNIHALDFLTGQERADLLAFLQSLTGVVPPDVGPPAATTINASK